MDKYLMVVALLLVVGCQHASGSGDGKATVVDDPGIVETRTAYGDDDEYQVPKHCEKGDLSYAPDLVRTVVVTEYVYLNYDPGADNPVSPHDEEFEHCRTDNYDGYEVIVCVDEVKAPTAIVCGDL